MNVINASTRPTSWKGPTSWAVAWAVARMAAAAVTVRVTVVVAATATVVLMACRPEEATAAAVA